MTPLGWSLRIPLRLLPPRSGRDGGWRIFGAGRRLLCRLRDRGRVVVSAIGPPSALPSRISATAPEGAAAGLPARRRLPGSDCISFEPSRLHLPSRPPPAPRFSAQLFRPRLGSPRVSRSPVLGRRLPELGRDCWAAASAHGSLPAQGRGVSGHRRADRRRFGAFLPWGAESRRGHFSSPCVAWSQPLPMVAGSYRHLSHDALSRRA